jgi:hypothetical protein
MTFRTAFLFTVVGLVASAINRDLIAVLDRWMLIAFGASTTSIIAIAEGRRRRAEARWRAADDVGIDSPTTGEFEPGGDAEAATALPDRHNSQRWR